MWLCGVDKHALSCLYTVTPRILRAMAERQSEFTNFRRIRIATGTWNVNGGKQFRSNLLGTAELADWLLDSPTRSGLPGSQGERCGLTLKQIPPRPPCPGLTFPAAHDSLRCGMWCPQSSESLERAVVSVSRTHLANYLAPSLFQMFGRVTGAGRSLLPQREILQFGFGSSEGLCH